MPITPLAHLAHWYSAFGFLGPALLTIGWFKLQARREQRRTAPQGRKGRDTGVTGTAVVAEYWTLERRDDRWVLVDATSDEVREAEIGTRVVVSPWLAADAPAGDPDEQPA